MFSRLVLFLTAAAATTFVHAQASPGRVTGNVNVHDPTLCKKDGKYFLFSTAPGIEIRTSTDRVAWTLVGKVWPNGAPWTDAYTLTSNGNLWAPDCTVTASGEFLLYYSASSFGSQNSAIFLARSSSGNPGTFTNDGLVTSTSTGNNYNAIDSDLLIEGNTATLTLGSFWTGIKTTNVSPTTGKPTGSAPVSSLASRGGNSIEASTIFKYNGFYYLFTSWGACCQGLKSTYEIRVGRALSAAGPYSDQAGVLLTNGGGTLIFGTHGSVVGPGGQDILLDTDGPLLVYHYYTSRGSLLGLNRLDFSSGWPVVV